MSYTGGMTAGQQLLAALGSNPNSGGGSAGVHRSSAYGRTSGSVGSRSSGVMSQSAPSSLGGTPTSVGTGAFTTTNGTSTPASSSSPPTTTANASSGNARARTVELFKYWAGTDKGQTAIKALVADALKQVEPSESAASSRMVMPDDMEVRGKGEDARAQPLRASMDGDPQINIIGMDDLPLLKTQQIEESLSPEQQRIRDGEPTSPQLAHTNSDLGSTTGSNGKKRQPRTTFSPHKSPREVKLTPNLGLTSHMVDEMDAVHMRGGLSPRSLSPAGSFNQDLHMVGASPLDRSLSDLQRAGSDVGSGRPKPLALDQMSSRRTEDSCSSRSTSPMSVQDNEQFSRQSSGRGPDMLGRRGTVSPSAKPAPVPVRKRVASYQDIPRFYFAEGRPQTTSTTLMGPHVDRHDNPHLIIHDGIAIPLGGGMSLSAENGQPPPGPRTAQMLPLAVMEDEDVGPFIMREFGTLPAAPGTAGAAASGTTGTRRGSALKGAGGSLRRPSTSAAGKESQYQQQLFAVMRRVVTQAFGLPGYFTKLVMAKLITATQQTSSPSSTPVGRPTTSHGGNQPKVISATAVKEFYEKHLRFKSIVRRMFEVLVTTSKATPAELAKAGVGASTDPDKRNFLVRSDFTPYIDVLLETHPGLSFLRQTADFQSKYLEAVLTRIFYELDRHDRGRISWPEFENSLLPDALRQVDATEDINTVLNFFSYEHFYVLYCRFWELDEDKDLMLGPSDLAKYAPEQTFNPLIVDRIFQGIGRPMKCKTKGKMSFEDFVWFCLSEEDKSTPRSIRYWFRVLDLDGDGVISGFELETFYNFTKAKLVQMTTEGINFDDVMCQVRDMLPTMQQDGIRLNDLLTAPHSAHVALNMVVSVVKFLQFEQRDPFVAHYDRLAGGYEKTEWDRFSRVEYDRMAAEADDDQ